MAKFWRQALPILMLPPPERHYLLAVRFQLVGAQQRA
jgi:hypothetical protein